MRHARAAALTLLLLLAGAQPVCPELAHPGRAVDPSALPVFGATKAAPKVVDWASLSFMALWASVVLIVLVLWYRRLRFDEDLEGTRPRLSEDDPE